MPILKCQLNVTVGEGQWADKIGAGALGLFIAWPLAITAGMGAFKQKKLPDEIFRTVENCIISGGRSAVYGGAEHSAHTAAETMACPKCGAQLPVGSKFCNQCGEKLGNVCPSCGAEVVQGSMFCSNCGQSYNKIKMFICERVDMFCQPVCNYINARVSTNHLPSSTKKSRV